MIDDRGLVTSGFQLNDSCHRQQEFSDHGRGFLYLLSITDILRNTRGRWRPDGNNPGKVLA